MRAATYTRLSASRLGEEAPGLERQREANERLIRERGWTLVRRFVEADVSAFRDVDRPRFAELREAVDRQELDAVVVWKLDRLFRRLKEGADFLDLCRQRGVALISVQEGVDTSSPYGGILFAIFASLGEIESQGRSDRITAWHQQRAERGLPTGGGTRAFGFKEDFVRHEPREAREIRKAAKALLDGATMRSVQRDWNRRGILTPPYKRNGVEVPGGPWSKTSVRRLLLSSRIAGLRQHGDETFPASWRGIISEEQHLALRARFNERRPPSRRRYLLTGGLAVCGLCGANLVARGKGAGRRGYVCAVDHGGCGKIAILATEFEEYVAQEANRAWEQSVPEEEPEREDASAIRAELAADEAALEELARDRYFTRSISPVEFQAVREPLIARIGEASERLAAVGRGRRQFLRELESLPPAPWEADPGTDPEDIDEWRASVAEVVEQVVVGPAVKGRNRFDSNRIEIRWRDLGVEVG